MPNTQPETTTPRCINCIYCMMHDSTCATPENNFTTIAYDDPACQYYEPETPVTK